MRRASVLGLALAALAVLTVPAWGQFITTVTDFEAAFDPPGDGLANVIFLDPSVSTSSRGINTGVFNDVYMCSLSTCGSFFQQVCSGQQSLTISWQWTDPSLATSWLRLSSTNTPWIPNPSLHLAGKVRFCLGGAAFTSESFETEVSGGQLYMNIGVRETGIGVPLGADGGTAGDVEWVGLSESPLSITVGPDGVCDTTADPADVQAAPVGTSPADGMCVTAGADDVLDTPEASLGGDDERLSTPRGSIIVPLDRVMRQYEFDLVALEAAGAVYPLLGDGTLGAVPNNRGVWESVAFTNHPQNSVVNAKQVILWLDDVVFEAPIPSPPTIVTLPDPPLPLDTSVDVANIDPTATLLEVYMLGRGTEPNVLLASVENPGTTDLTVSLDIPLPYGVSIVVRQTVNEVQSDYSSAIGINVPGNAPVRMAMSVRETDEYDHNLNCGDNGTGFDPSQPSTLEFIGAIATEGFGIPQGRRITPAIGWQDIVFNPCTDGVIEYSGNGVMDLTGVGYTNGVWESLFFRIDSLAPSAGPYQVYIDDMVAINGLGDGVDCLIDDFESYEVQQYIVESAAGTADSVAAGDDVQIVSPGATTYAGQIVISGGPNGVIDTEPATGEGVTNNRARFQLPSTAGGSQGLSPEPNITAIDDTQAFSGSHSLRLEFAFVAASNPRSQLRLTTNGSTADPPPDLSRMPDSVIPFSSDNTWCDGTGDIAYAFKMKLEPSPIQGDCNDDLDVDLLDYACLQECATQTTLSPLCDEKFDYFNDDSIDADDLQMFLLSVSGPY
ncbi:MAG: hypothetical protein JXB13_17890 [Phycisphaerae bacterium]|nr:hypothetical protein [Phycisphaerae bacterium]